MCDSRIESGRLTRGVYEGHCWTERGLPSKDIARTSYTYGPARMSKDVLTEVLVRRGHGWMLRGRRIWYSMHSMQSARPGCRCCRACTFTWLMARQDELVARRGLQDRHLSHAGGGQRRREELETRLLIANLVACTLPTSS
jgi:hypothetical protein